MWYFINNEVHYYFFLSSTLQNTIAESSLTKQCDKKNIVFCFKNKNGSQYKLVT